MNKSKKFNINHNVIIYPNKKGWKKLIKIHSDEYNVTKSEAEKYINSHTVNGGFQEQLWVLMDIYHKIFYCGTNYLESTFITLIEE